MIFSSSRSFLFKNKMTDEFWNQGYVMIVLNSALLSSIRFYRKRGGKGRVRDSTSQTLLAKYQTIY